MGSRKRGPGRVFGLLLVFLVSGTGCNPNSDGNSVPDRNHTLNILYPAEPVSLDPSVTYEAYAAVILDHTFERLVRLDRSGVIVPAAASGWTVSPDGKTYTFTLRDRAKWSDGKPVTAEDFRVSWLRGLDPRNQIPHRSSLAPYILNAQEFSAGTVSADRVGSRTSGDRTLTVELKTPVSFFLSMITYWSFSPVRLDVVRRAGPGWDKVPGDFVTNGPYKMAEYQKGSSVLLVRNPSYWNRDAIRVPAIRVYFQQPGQDPFQLFRNGDMDCISNVQATDIPSIPDLRANLHIDQALGTMIIFVNHKSKRLTSPEFREALSVSIDRRKIVDEVVNTAGTPTRFFIPPSLVVDGQKFHDFTALSQPPDLVLGGELLRKAGGTGQDRTKPLRLYYKNGQVAAKTAAILAEGWKKSLGISVETSGMEWTDLLDLCQKGDYDLALLSYSAEFPHPMSFLGQFLPGAPCSVFTHWSDGDFQKDLVATSEAPGGPGSLPILQELESRIIDGHHIIPLYYTKLLCLMSERVEGWYRNGVGLAGFTFDEATLRPR